MKDDLRDTFTLKYRSERYVLPKHEIFREISTSFVIFWSLSLSLSRRPDKHATILNVLQSRYVLLSAGLVSLAERGKRKEEKDMENRKKRTVGRKIRHTFWCYQYFLNDIFVFHFVLRLLKYICFGT